MTFSGVLMDEPGATHVVVTDAAGTAHRRRSVIDGTRLTQRSAAARRPGDRHLARRLERRAPGLRAVHVHRRGRPSQTAPRRRDDPRRR
jgi:hypothetical protein